MENNLERKQVEKTTYGYYKEFLAASEQTKIVDIPKKVPEPIVVNPLKFVEDAVEQNDNNFDGIINNAPQVPNNEMTSANPSEGQEEEKKKSVLAQLHANQQTTFQNQVQQACELCQDAERNV